MFHHVSPAVLAFSVLTVAVAASATGGTGVADVAATAPAIVSAGAIHAVPAAAYQPNPTATYKVVFNLTRGAAQPARINPGLEHVARAVNLYAHAGVPLKQLKFVAIASGAATASVLLDARYRQQFGVSNPNLPVIAELRKAGVEVAVCGQAIAEHHYADDWVDPRVTVALAALTTAIELQQKGYALVPL